jgi:transposase
MTFLGVGPVVALVYTATIDIPARFRHSKAAGAILGLTPILHQSGESLPIGRILLWGDSLLRRFTGRASTS